jgi:hypothetical protein
MDESSPQTTANTQRLWSFGKPVIYKNTSKRIPIYPGLNRQISPKRATIAE